MYSWYTNNRKKVQRQVNKIFRQMNRIIENDDLWRGRFVVRQKHTEWVNYYGSREYFLYVTYEFIDKKTGKVSRPYHDVDFAIDRRIGIYMNTFIINDCKVWEKGNPYEDKTDYRKVSI